ncbi:MAG: hypothetical protein ABR572_12515, partial [Cryomorphaceae bacterium]
LTAPASACKSGEVSTADRGCHKCERGLNKSLVKGINLFTDAQIYVNVAIQRPRSAKRARNVGNLPMLSSVKLHGIDYFYKY